jgi:hypothetical protein
MRKQIFVVGACGIWLFVGGMNQANLSTSQKTFQKLLGVSKNQDRNELISKNSHLLSDIDSNNSKQIQGFIQYESWDGSNCNGTKTDIQGFQTDYCMLHSSGNGSYEMQISDG